MLAPTKIPKGFKLMGLRLNLTNEQVEKFEQYVLKYVLCSYWVFYTKKPTHGTLTEIWLYCRPKDEVQLAYHIGCAAGSSMFHNPIKFWKNQIHDVAQPFPNAYHINIELPNFPEEFVETYKNSSNITRPIKKPIKSPVSKKK